MLPTNRLGNSGRGRCENAAALPIAGPDIGAESEAGVVRNPDGVVLVVGDDHRRHRPEKFLVVGGHPRFDVGQDGRRIEGTGPVRDFPAGSERLTADAPTGMRHVLVNGQPIQLDGKLLDDAVAQRPGQLVRPAVRS